MEADEKQVVAKWQYEEMIKELDSLVLEALEDGELYAPSILSAIDSILKTLDLDYRGVM